MMDDARLSDHPIHIEFRDHQTGVIPYTDLQKFIEIHGGVQVDSCAKTHKEVVDLLMVGAQRVAIDINSKDKEIALGHAVSEHLMLRISLPSEMTLTYLTDELFPRLNEVKEYGPENALVISRRKGDLSFVMDKLPDYLRKSFRWWLAPDEGVSVHLRSNEHIAGWAVDGARLIGD